MAEKFFLVTGGAGFLGSAFVKRLVRDGYKVRVLDNLSRGDTKRLSGLGTRVEFINADIRDARAVEGAARGVDSVCHLAFVNGTEFFYTRPDWVLEVGVKGITNVLDACRKRKVPELVVASSSEVYQTAPRVPTDETAPLSIPDPLNPRYSYAVGKIISEVMALNYGIKHLKRVLVFRPHNVYGPDMGNEHVIPQFALRLNKLCRQYPKGVIRFPIQGTGRESRAFIFIDDFVEGLMLVLRKGAHRQIYHVGTGDQVQIRELAQLMGKCFRRRLRIVPGERAKGGPLHRCPDIGKLKRLGFKPKYSLEQGLPVTIQWYCERSQKKSFQ